MDQKEAKAVIKIMLTADGGCYYCARDLIEQFIRAFPEFAPLANEMLPYEDNRYQEYKK